MKDHDEKMSNMERVLRAMDVIPPFGGPVSPERLQSIPPAKSPDEPPVEPETDSDVPTLDLGEKILAEQRRVTAGKRRGPGGDRPTVRTDSDESPVIPKTSPEGASEEELAELQSIVADIVARDIERLCTGPQRSFC